MTRGGKKKGRSSKKEKRATQKKGKAGRRHPFPPLNPVEEKGEKEKKSRLSLRVKKRDQKLVGKEKKEREAKGDG